MIASELWQWVHSCYGDELGLTSDDDDYIAPSTTEDEQRYTNTNALGGSRGVTICCGPYEAASARTAQMFSMWRRALVWHMLSMWLRTLVVFPMTSAGTGTIFWL